MRQDGRGRQMEGDLEYWGEDEMTNANKAENPWG